jgi:hypothetical protein
MTLLIAHSHTETTKCHNVLTNTEWLKDLADTETASGRLATAVNRAVGSVSRGVQHPIAGCLLINKLPSIWNEAVGDFKNRYSPEICLHVLRKMSKNLSQDVQCFISVHFYS